MQFRNTRKHASVKTIRTPEITRPFFHLNKFIFKKSSKSKNISKSSKFTLNNKRRIKVVFKILFDDKFVSS